MYNNYIIGYGEIGKCIADVIDCDSIKIDINNKFTVKKENTVLHICYGFYDETFIDSVVEYIKYYEPVCTIIHSTVKPGTCKKIIKLTGDENIVYSPVRGRHKTLAYHVRNFVKYYYSDSKKASGIFRTIFSHLNIKKFDGFNSLEIAKIYSTSYMYWNLCFQKELKEICDSHNADFDYVYSEWNKTYNDMCNDIIYPHNFKRPIYEYMQERVGGHCLNENLSLDESVITDIIKDLSVKYG